MQNSIAIALAWPETRCKQTGAWYDRPAEFLSISKNNYYKVGHSAIVLINPKNKKCLYFDFGRYHTPLGYGRVRDEQTDFDLKIETLAEMSDNLILSNYQNIIDEIQQNPSSHGDGQLYAALTKINFENAYSKAKQMQNCGIINYGPFVINGTNCSRFVRSVLLSAEISLLLQFKIRFTRTLSPTPIGVVNNLNQQRKANFRKRYFSVEKSVKECEIITS